MSDRSAADGQRPRRAMTLALFTAISFLSAALVFLVQPMATRLLLPRFGGSAAVWNTAMVVFQTLLLGGYIAAHALMRFSAGTRRIVQVVLLALPALALPFALPESTTISSPTLQVVAGLTLMVGAPYFALTTMSPTIQRWFGETDHPLALNPYPLYAAGNAGSLLALLAYPLMFEPLLDLRDQTIAFAVGYGVLVLLLVGGAGEFFLRHQPVTEDRTAVAAIDGTPQRDRLSTSRVIYLAFVPSFLLLGVTRHLSIDVAAFPLLWIIPLVIYLASFVAAFRGDTDRALPVASRVLRLTLIPAVIVSSGFAISVLSVALSLPLLVFAAAAYVAHRRLYEGRPDLDGLTRFYVLLSVGGALGGVAGALLAPVAFESILEYPIGLVLTATLIVRNPTSRSRTSHVAGVALFAAATIAAVIVSSDAATVILLGVAGIIAFALSWRSWVFTVAIALLAVAVLQPKAGSRILLAERTFYGTYQVRELDDAHVLLSGTTVHGAQLWSDGEPRPAPMGYYAEEGPIGRALDVLGSTIESMDVGVIGLGAGALATYLDASDSLTFYEIDEAVVDIAMNPDLFTFLADTAGHVSVVVGDGRLELERISPQHDALIIDAFSSDAIPIHLLTLEAVETYLDSITPEGVLAFHISNRHLSLAPVVGTIVDELGLTARIASYQPGPDQPLASASLWVVAARSADAIDLITIDPMWAPTPTGGPLWTDDYSNVVSVIRWR